MRLQNTSEDETTNNQDFQSTLRLPASNEIYLALKPEGVVSFKEGELKITIKAGSLRDLKARVNSWLRLYDTLKGVEMEVIK